MSEFMKGQKEIEKSVVSKYQKIEDTVVSGYKKIEDGFVDGYKRIEDSFVKKYLTPDEIPSGQSQSQNKAHSTENKGD